MLDGDALLELRPISSAASQFLTGYIFFCNATRLQKIMKLLSIALAIVAAVALTLRRRKDTKYFDPAKAVKVKRSDRIRIVSMKAESDRANVAAKTEA